MAACSVQHAAGCLITAAVLTVAASHKLAADEHLRHSAHACDALQGALDRSALATCSAPCSARWSAAVAAHPFNVRLAWFKAVSMSVLQGSIAIMWMAAHGQCFPGNATADATAAQQFSHG